MRFRDALSVAGIIAAFKLPGMREKCEKLYAGMRVYCYYQKSTRSAYHIVTINTIRVGQSAAGGMAQWLSDTKEWVCLFAPLSPPYCTVSTYNMHWHRNNTLLQNSTIIQPAPGTVEQ